MPYFWKWYDLRISIMIMTRTFHWCPRDDNDKDKRKDKDKDKDKDKMTKRPNMCHIFENDMTQGYQLWWWRMNQWLITFVMHWCAGALMRWCCWCTDAADALMLLMRWYCWCADAADAQIFADLSIAFCSSYICSVHDEIDVWELQVSFCNICADLFSKRERAFKILLIILNICHFVTQVKILESRIYTEKGV